MNNENMNEQTAAKVSLPGLPLVSIITVCLNSENHLEQTILSVLNQTYGNIEYIIVDGGSIDKTPDIIKKYESRIARWVSEPDKGICDAMNKGISFARGEWVGIINSDDWYVPDTVRWVVEAALQKPETGVIFGNLMQHKLEDGRVVRCPVKGRVEGDGRLLENPLPHPACFVARNVYEQFRFNPAFKIAPDYDLMARLYAGGVKFGHIDRTLAHYRIGGTSAQAPYRLIIEGYLIRSRYHRLKALRKWLYLTGIFPLVYLYLRLPWTVRKKYQVGKNKVRAIFPKIVGKFDTGLRP